jgi:hypothetical protein
MRKQNKLINKVKRLIRRAGLPRWLHNYGPKKYEFWQHALALIIKQECKLGYRRVSNFLNMLGFSTPTYSALAKMIGRIGLNLWQSILRATSPNALNLVAIDGSGMSRPLPSPYYYRRIDKPYPIEIPLKLSIAVDTRTKKIVSLRVRSKRSHDIKDAKYLIRNLPSKPKCIIADKGYDAEWLHQFCNDRGIDTCIPIRNYGKPRVGITRLRHTKAKKIKQRRYGRREMVESVFSATKRKFGASVSSTSVIGKRTEMYCRAIAHNIISYFRIIFSTQPY